MKINKIYFLCSRLPQPERWIFWIAIAIFIKTLFFLYKLFEAPLLNITYQGSFAIGGGDTFSYIEPIENLLSNGTYSDDYRMPGYGGIYFMLRLVFNQPWSLNILVILQLALSSVSVYALGLIAKAIFKNNSSFYISFIIYLASAYVSLFDSFLLTESFCTSSLILSVLFFINYYQSNNIYFLLPSGFFITWSIFLRPTIAPLLILFILFIFIKKILDKSTAWKSLFYFLLPFILADGLWMARNYMKYKKIYPLTRTIYYSSAYDDYYVKLADFVSSFGGSIVHWNPGAEMCFFIPPPDYIKKKADAVLPEYIYTSKFNYDSLVMIKNYIHEINDTTAPEKRKKYLTPVVKRKLNDYRISIKEEKPFLYYVTSRLKLLKTFFVHSGTYNLFAKVSFELNKLEWGIKLVYSLLYIFVVSFGFMGSLLMLLKVQSKNEVLMVLVAMCGLYHALVFPLVLKMDQYRYFVPGYPFFVLASVFVLISMRNFIKKTSIKK